MITKILLLYVVFIYTVIYTVLNKSYMRFISYIIIFFLYSNNFSTHDYTKELSWQERKEYAKNFLNLFINKK